LAKVCHDFFRGVDSESSVSPCLSDYALTNILWLKKPLAAPDLPRKRIIADYYAATKPDEYLWKRYVEEVKKLEAGGTVTPEDYYMLRYSPEAEDDLMRITAGEEEAITQVTVEEMLELARLRAQTEVTADRDAERERRIQAEDALAALQEQARSNRLHLYQLGHTFARSVVRVVDGLVLLVVAGALALTFPWELPLLGESTLLRLIAAVLVWLVFFITVNHLMYGTAVAEYVRRLEDPLGDWAATHLIRWFGPRGLTLPPTDKETP